MPPYLSNSKRNIAWLRQTTVTTHGIFTNTKYNDNAENLLGTFKISGIMPLNDVLHLSLPLLFYKTFSAPLEIFQKHMDIKYPRERKTSIFFPLKFHEKPGIFLLGKSGILRLAGFYFEYISQ